MSLTRRYLKFLSEQLYKLGEFAISPWIWATKTCPDPEHRNKFTNDLLECGVCAVCNCMICCCKTPFACIGSAVTIPLGGTTAIVFGIIGGVGTAIPLAVDGVRSCTKKSSEQSTDKLNNTNTKYHFQRIFDKNYNEEDKLKENIITSTNRPANQSKPVHHFRRIF